MLNFRYTYMRYSASVSMEYNNRWFPNTRQTNIHSSDLLDYVYSILTAGSDGCWVGGPDSLLWTVNIRLVFRDRNIDKLVSYFVFISNEFKNSILNINSIQNTCLKNYLHTSLTEAEHPSLFKTIKSLFFK